MLALADAQEGGTCNSLGQPMLLNPLLTEKLVSFHFQQLHDLRSSLMLANALT